MKKLTLLFRELFVLVRRNRLYFLFPILVSLVLLALLVYSLGPTALVTFLYAGI